MNGGSHPGYLQLNSNHSVAAGMNEADGGTFARGVGFEPGADGDGGRRGTVFGALKEAYGRTSPARAAANQTLGGTGGEGNVEKGAHEHVEDLETTRRRRLWVALTWALTWWVPTPLLTWCGRMKRPDVRMAWREKVAICVIIVFLWFLLLFLIIGLGLILCPKENVWTMDDIAGMNTPSKSYISTRGSVYDVTDFIKQTGHGDSRNRARPDQLVLYSGNDVNASFPITARAACPDLVSADRDPNYLIQYPVAGASSTLIDPLAGTYFKHAPQSDPTSSELSDRGFYWKHFEPSMKKFLKGGVVWKMDSLNTLYKDLSIQWLVINKEVFYMQPYIDAINYQGNTNNTYNFLDSRFEALLSRGGYGTADITEDWNGIRWSAATRQSNYNCLKRLFYVGKVDDRQSVRCLFTNYMLVAFACVLMLVVLVKFLAAMQFGNKSRPAPPEKFVVCQVPCYTEDEESIAKTLESLAALEYVDKHKLIFVICDGNIVGSGNEKSTPRIVLDILGVDPDYDPPARDYLAIAEGSRRHNIAKVYSGLFEHEGHTVPFMVVAKIGAPEEANRSGNRGKRDSQILLMSFFNKVHFNLPMTPLELEIYHQMRHIIGVPPRNYEYLLQVDADTEVLPDSLSRLVSACTGDRRIAGICGETMLGNESRSMTTMIQVYEYFISHHMAKAFESLFGSVTCLPGCFSMFRLRTTEGKPLLIAKQMLADYSELHVDTLHKKNLLSLGEDRYLTTLMMKHFPRHKLKFIHDAKCRTIAPEKWSVLISQRRRWINSTIHNLAELMFLSDMCGFCFFSMRFVVFLDLFGTITMPCTLIYFAYLIYAAVRNIADVGYISLILIGAIYGVQVVIFILRREWQHIGWMLIYLLSFPLWSFILPIYSFWHMDDFSWGNTRVVVGDGKRKIIVEDDKPFDPASIPQRRWMEYEKELAVAGVLNAPPPNMNPRAGSSKEDDRLSLYSSQSGGGGGAHLSRAESALAFAHHHHHPQSMYGSPVMPAAGYDPRLSVAMTNPQMMMMLQQQQQQQQQQQNAYDMSVGRNSTASSGAMTPIDPRLSVAMTSHQHQQMLMQQQQQQSAAYMGAPETWAAGAPASMYMQDVRPGSFAGQQQQQQQQQHSVYVPMQEMGSSGRTTPQFGGGVLSMPGGAPFPSDDAIIDAVRRILVNADLTTTTKKAIRARLAREFGVDLSAKKEFISRTIDAMLIGSGPN
ncbi:hypothetical protein H4R18_004547 [Coemansia javaensis]|uniref:chitin synthase n=1 Tax=Coemansia javaensis TaxID=2761396 RepID=A0A9W8H943_9FUNG|nr:hypothetical protein H4R18_004547 [Coemansia javaensis]